MMRPGKALRRWSGLKAFTAVGIPFLCALLLGIMYFRAGASSGLSAIAHRQPNRAVLEQNEVACLGQGCSQGKEGDAAVRPQLGAAATGAGSVGDAPPATAARTSDELPPPSELPQLFMFIGILSGRGYRHRRLAVREAWANRAQVQGLVVSKFILSEDERTPQVQKELETYNDIVFVKEKTNYKSILYKTFFVLEYAVKHYDVKFVLKTDDDAYINVQPIIDQLQALCENPDCQRERLYIGKMAKHSEVLLTPGHKWNNAIFYNHTGLKVYPNYMMGGGYVMSGEVCRILVDVHARMRLKFTPIEDATLGFWLMAMDLRHIDHPKFYTWAAPCCFKAPVRKQGQRLVTRFQLAEEFEEDLCSNDPWLVLHKIDSPTKMRYVGARVANCSLSGQPKVDEALRGLAPSIEPYLPPHKAALLQRGGSAGGGRQIQQVAGTQQQRPVEEYRAADVRQQQQQQQQGQQLETQQQQTAGEGEEVGSGAGATVLAGSMAQAAAA